MVAEEAKNHFETGRCSDSDGFSARHSSREYGYYEQFRGFRSGPVNGTMSNYMRLVLLILYFLYFSLPDYVDPINVYVENCYTCTGTCTCVPVRRSTCVDLYVPVHVQSVHTNQYM